MPGLRFPERRSPPFPTSFPSFFHQDQAFAEALELDPGVDLPVFWRERVDCWRTLLVLWLLGALVERRVLIPEALRPFLPGGATRRVTDVAWLLRGAGEATAPLGVVSPVILVRPLPDLGPLRREAMPNAIVDQQQIKRRLGRLKSDIADAALRAPSYQPLRQLQRILQQQFPDHPAVADAQGTPQPFNLLDHRSLEMRQVILHLGDRQQTFVPLCACGAVLLPARAPLTIGQDHLVLRCATCSSSMTLRLDQFFCGWGRSSPPRFVAWGNRPPLWHNQAPPTPPPVTIHPGVEGPSVLFDFRPQDHAALIDRNAQDRRLELVLPPGVSAVPLRTEDATYSSPLRPEVEAGITAIPLKREYFDLWDGQIETAGPTAVRLGLVGLPAAVKIAVTAAPLKGIAVIPDTRRVPPNWRRFEVISEPGQQVGVDADARTGDRLLLDSPPHVIGVQVAGGAGCTLVLSEEEPAEPAVRLKVAVDFGTTSSVVYIRRQAEGGQWREDAFQPAASRDHGLRWLVPRQPGQDQLLDTVFPRPSNNALADALVPSEVCRSHGRIRMSQTPCCDAWEAFFKNDPQASTVRRKYWRELLAGAVAQSLGRLAGRPTGLELECVFTFPLTFNYQDVERLRRELRTLAQDLRNDLGLDALPSIDLVDEPSAGVLSIGAPQASQWVLIADLGGGTLDVAFGKGLGAAAVAHEAGMPEWIGSLDLGGRYLLEAVGDARLLQAKIRTRATDARVLFDRPATQSALERYFAAIGFYLGVLAIARLRSEIGDSIRFYPLGNGWHLWDLTANEHIAPEQLYRTRLVQFVDRLARFLTNAAGRNVTVSVQPEDPSPSWHPKHAVAQGAVHARSRDQASVALPAGTDFVVPNRSGRRVDWWQPVGPVAKGWDGLVLDTNVVFEHANLMTNIDAFNAHSPAHAQLSVADDDLVRRELTASANAVPNETAPTGYLRGPLQILTEKVWRNRLRQ